MSAPDYGKTFGLLRTGAGQTWTDYTQHAFVEGLKDGSLPRESFLHYLVQDYVFLVHFARAWSLGVVKSETQQEMRVCAQTVDALVNHEMSLHVKTCAAAGIDESALFNAAEADANLAYTRYVLDAGLQGDFIDLIAALSPCVMGYGEIGVRLAADQSADTPYSEWIATYADPAYQTVCATVGDMMDAAVARRIGDFATSPRRAAVQARFTKATALEVGFWQMGLSSE